VYVIREAQNAETGNGEEQAAKHENTAAVGAITGIPERDGKDACHEVRRH
jgi:hypothetical protein